ncbi:MAG: 50S ribosomal protein L10, partial [Nanobdellota archaeon]
MEYKTKANDLKKSQVEKFIEKEEKYPIIGIVNVEGLPTPQLQAMREKLRDKVEIIVGKSSLIKLALKKESEKKKGVEKLINEMKGMPALIFTEQNPFT